MYNVHTIFIGYNTVMPKLGGQRATGPPNIWQISWPYSNRGGQIIPTYYYWPPQSLSPSGTTAVVILNDLK